MDANAIATIMDALCKQKKCTRAANVKRKPTKDELVLQMRALKQQQQQQQEMEVQAQGVLPDEADDDVELEVSDVDE